MRYKPLSKSLYVKNREKLVKKMKPNSIAVFNANDLMPSNADGTFKFRQNNNLFYLSGIDQEETLLVLCPDFPNKNLREVLFVKETNEHIAIWEGNKLTQNEAKEVSGIKNVHWTKDFDRIFSSLMTFSEHVYLDTNEHQGAAREVETRNDRFVKSCKELFPLHDYQRAAPLLQELRAVKEGEEIDQIQKACEITDKAFRRVLKFVRPGVMEYEIEAEFLHEFIRHGSRGFSFEPIMGSGPNSCVLHYLDNDKHCQSGDLILMDVGAEYGNYNSDMTRTIPINGRFSPRQKEVYNAVLRVKKEASKMLRPGISVQDFHIEVGKIMESELIGLGLLDKTDIKHQNPNQPLYKKYFMHGTSHHLGLDVHDLGPVFSPIQPGMVFTIEPGIYIREENIGIRLENDWVVQEKDNLDLMKNIPIEVEEIEEIMNTN
ncbi:aminopeptidase P N-terminal domain-containing protein [Echinicola jeungdonensis]|uniref:Xaa-Pro aminopeptidase n=1 Tax=Echinicola jeungdonensis TaxID=709343 RepID=A0ABV5JAP8_9BACT|nr:aminopeptidase P N-terminal domain-containing protein [Echinicola jeungdonensis]MDN3669941.1 aminopeptidase P N-terminal domain-containing protein [Echinicola jeungdonensis]